MKRNMGARKKGPVLSDSSNKIFDDDTPENNSSNSEEEDMIKRKKLVERRRSYIEMDKNKKGENPGRNGHNADLNSDLDDTDDGNAENVAKAKKIRRRLSKRMDEINNQNRTSNVSGLNLSYGNLNSDSPTVNSPRNQPTDKKTLNEIYSTCSALFQAHVRFCWLKGPEFWGN